MDFNFSDIEERYRAEWQANRVYATTNDSDKPKYYILDMFPYPSGSGLHVGHPLGYVASDIYARYKRLTGFNVLHPMGFDSFGLPAEQYAISKGTHPSVTTAENSANYRRQLDNLGLSFDWDRAVNTADPKYYKWTQWIVTQLFAHYYDKKIAKALPIEQLVRQFEHNGSIDVQAATSGDWNFTAADWKAMSVAQQDAVLMTYRLAYRTMGYVNWCEALSTVLANDEIVNGVSERGGHPVTKKEMYQWNLRITAYSDRLIAGLEDLDWSEAIKNMQRNWIGRSEGAIVRFQTASSPVTVFTTRPDTIFGVTFLVLAPENLLVQNFTTDAQRADIDAYIAYVKSRSEVERQQEKTVSGVFTGAYATHPFTGEAVPIWISEYVLAGYGTGAIMAVPSDDERDKAFAQKFDLPIIDVVDESMYPNASLDDKLGKIINSDFLNGLEVKEAITLAIDKLAESGVGARKTNYKLRDANMSRQRYWGEPYPIIYAANGSTHALPLAQLPLELPHLEDFKPTGESPLARLHEWKNIATAFEKKEGTLAVREVDTMPGFAGSSWYSLRYMDNHNDNEFAGKKALEYWEDVDFYMGGTEHAVGHLLYARTFHQFLYDLGHIKTPEPFRKLVNQGMIQGISQLITIQLSDKSIELHVPVDLVDEKGRLFYDKWLEMKRIDNRFESYGDETVNWQEENGERYTQLRALVEKMSKSKHNVINPDDMVARYGADNFRMFEMFLGPIEASKPFDIKGIKGVEGFLRKYIALFYDEKGQFAVSNDAPTADDLRALHTCIKKVTEDIERLQMNTCISTFMIATNALRDLKCNKRAVLQELNILLAPFAPFVTEEIWHRLGNADSIHNTATFPTHNDKYLKSDTVDYPVQINGKKRANILLPAGLSAAELEALILANEEVQKYLMGATPKKVIIVPNRLVSLVV